MSEYEPVEIAESVDPIQVAEATANADPQRALTDLVILANAGAGLYHALYHCSAQWWATVPDHVVRAYVKAQRAYGIGRAS